MLQGRKSPGPTSVAFTRAGPEVFPGPLGLLRPGRALWGGVQEPLGGHRGCSLGRSRCSSPQVRPSGPSFRQCTSGRNAGWVGASGDPSSDRGPWVSRAPPARHPRVSALPGAQPSPTHSLGHPHCPGLEPLCSALPPSTPPSSTSWSRRELGQLGKFPRSAASRREPVHPYWGRGWGPWQSARTALSPLPREGVLWASLWSAQDLCVSWPQFPHLF